MWHSSSVEEIAKNLKTNINIGLSDDEAQKRFERYGPNNLKEKKKESIFVKFLKQFNDFMIITLIIAAIISAVVSKLNGEADYIDSIIIVAIVIFNAIMGLVQEQKAEKSLEALKKMTAPNAKVRRNGRVQEIDATMVVPGDIVILEAGNYVPADCRLINSYNLKIEESALTGETIPSLKDSSKILKENTAMGDLCNMVFATTIVVNGHGEAIVVETGMNTRVGKIAGMIIEDESPETPIQKKLAEVGKILAIACIIICVLIFVIGIFKKIPIIEMFMTSVGLAVAAIPEGLPAIVTIMLSIGVTKMAKKNSIIRKLPAVETLGSSSVICSDKTGTLTQNKMTVTEIRNCFGRANSNERKFILELGTMCTDTTEERINGKLGFVGEATEVAISNAAMEEGVSKSFLYDEMKRINDIPFDSKRKMMTTIHKYGNGYRIITKGAPDVLLKRCSNCYSGGQIVPIFSKKDDINEQNNQMAEKALRVIAVAYKDVEKLPEMQDVEKDLIFCGLIGMIDPPREGVKEAVRTCRRAGIKTVMITGDHKVTAVAIAKELGILEDGEDAITGSQLETMSQEELIQKVENIRVYARVSPEHKVRIVKAWQAHGEIVAMTGDGVNDAPALKTADIGCAMGIVGTDVAKEAADVILTDDNFATVVSAVEEGRRIYDNIIKAIQFLLSSNVGEVIVLFFAILLTPFLATKFGIPIGLIEPLLPIHILWINLVTDSLPALALAFDPANKDVMKRKPVKASSGIFTKGMTWRIIYQGIMIGLLSLAAFVIGISTPNPPVIEGLTQEQVRVEIGQTMTFIVLAFSELIHVFNIRNNKESIFKIGIGGNKQLFWAIGASAMLMLVILAIPVLRAIFSIPVLPMDRIVETIALVIAPVVIVEIFKLLKINTSKDE